MLKLLKRKRTDYNIDEKYFPKFEILWKFYWIAYYTFYSILLFFLFEQSATSSRIKIRGMH